MKLVYREMDLMVRKRTCEGEGRRRECTRWNIEESAPDLDSDGSRRIGLDGGGDGAFIFDGGGVNSDGPVRCVDGDGVGLARSSAFLDVRLSIAGRRVSCRRS